MPDAHKYEHVMAFALEHPWAVTPSMRTIIAGILARRMVGQDADPAEIAAALVNRKNLPQPGDQNGAVAIIPVYGVIAPRMNLLSEMSGGTTFEKLTAQLHEAMGNKAVKTIVFDVDSPGGNVAGATEFAREVMKARTKKPIIAQAQYLMASAAYWTMACATEVVAAPSAMVGSVGVYTIHDDVSEALAQLGVKREVISAGKYKAEAMDGFPLSDAARGHIQSLVTDVHERMLGDISKGRGAQIDVVRVGYGQGRSLSAEDALAAGMVDRIATLDETLARVMSAAPTTERAAALAEHTGSTSDTSQEPLQATGQDRAADIRWQTDMERALFELSL
jgi:signal peptide peptidase SppA